jgi:hypothetical protein
MFELRVQDPELDAYRARLVMGFVTALRNEVSPLVFARPNDYW